MRSESKRSVRLADKIIDGLKAGLGIESPYKEWEETAAFITSLCRSVGRISAEVFDESTIIVEESLDSANPAEKENK